MVSKNNKIVREAKLVPHQEHFTLRKLSIGFVSVLLGVTFMAYNGGDSALAATTDPTAIPRRRPVTRPRRIIIVQLQRQIIRITLEVQQVIGQLVIRRHRQIIILIKHKVLG